MLFLYHTYIDNKIYVVCFFNPHHQYCQQAEKTVANNMPVQCLPLLFKTAYVQTINVICSFYSAKCVPVCIKAIQNNRPVRQLPIYLNDFFFLVLISHIDKLSLSSAFLIPIVPVYSIATQNCTVKQEIYYLIKGEHYNSLSFLPRWVFANYA